MGYQSIENNPPKGYGKLMNNNYNGANGRYYADEHTNTTKQFYILQVQ
jgi:hypothetical protein